jgi:hypothetical protein
MNHNIETELIASEVGYFIRPKQSMWKAIAEGVAFAALLVGLLLLLLWLASIGAF